MIFLILFFGYGIFLNAFGPKIVYISAAVGFGLAIITFGWSAYISAFLVAPLVMRFLYEKTKPFMSV